MPDTRETNGNLLGIHGYPALLSNILGCREDILIPKQVFLFSAKCTKDQISF